jgi:hypothetical protein
MKKQDCYRSELRGEMTFSLGARIGIAIAPKTVGDEQFSLQAFGQTY